MPRARLRRRPRRAPQIAAQRAQRAIQVDAALQLRSSAAARVRQGILDSRTELTATESWIEQRDALLQLDSAALSCRHRSAARARRRLRNARQSRQQPLRNFSKASHERNHRNPNRARERASGAGF
jgi:hypothetical protein